MESIDKNRISALERIIKDEIRTRELLSKRLSPREVDLVLERLNKNLDKLKV